MQLLDPADPTVPAPPSVLARSAVETSILSRIDCVTHRAGWLALNPARATAGR